MTNYGGTNGDSQTTYPDHSRLFDLMDAITGLRSTYRREWLAEYTPYRMGTALGRWDDEYQSWKHLPGETKGIFGKLPRRSDSAFTARAGGRTLRQALLGMGLREGEKDMNRWVWGIFGRILPILLLWSGLSAKGHAAAWLSIFPTPREVEARNERFSLDPSIPILVPQAASHEDLALAQFLTAELSDKHGLACKTQRASALPSTGPFILMGGAGNPLIQEYLKGRGVGAAVHAPEGYLLEVDAHAVVIAGADEAGAFYGLQSLRQLIQDEAAHIVRAGSSCARLACQAVSWHQALLARP